MRLQCSLWVLHTGELEMRSGVVLPSGILSLITLYIFSSSADLSPIESEVVILYGLHHLNYRNRET